MKIAHVDAETGFSGGEVQVFLLIDGLARLGYEGAVFCPPGSRSEGEARRRGIPVHTIPMANDLDLRAIAGLRLGLSRCRPDLVHLHTGRATWLGGLAAWMLSLPAITTRRMDKPIGHGWRQRVTYGPLVARAVAVSCAVREALFAGGVAPGKVVLIHDAVDAREGECPSADGALRTALGASADAVVLLAIASLHRRKGLDVLLDALARTKSRGIVLWIAGDGPERSSLEAQAKGLRCSEQVRFLGFRRDVPSLLDACDVVVLPSRQEGLGVAALEGMAARRPVVASRVGGLEEVVVDGRTGILVPREDPDRLAMAIDRLADDPGLRQRLGGAGPARISEGFLASQMVSAYDELYRSVVEERRTA